MSSFKRAVVCALSILLLSVASVPVSADTDSVAQLLERRADAIRVHDENAYMATVDPKSADAFKASERARYQGLMSVPFADYQLIANESDVGDLASGLQLKDRYSTEAVSLPETVESFRLGDYDERPMRNLFWYTYVKRDGDWYVAALHDGDVLGLQSSPNIWDSGAVYTRAGPHFLVISSPAKRERADTLADAAEAAMGRFLQEWPVQWHAKIPLILPSSREEAATLLRLSNDVAKFAAFTSYQPIRDVDWQASPPRLFAEDENLINASARSQQGTIVHELVHAASASLAGPATPVWLQEGLAEWIRMGKPVGKLPPTSTKSLPDGAAFASSDAQSLTNAYTASTSAVQFLASVKGPDAPLKLLQATGARRAATGSPAYNTDQAMREVTGWTLADFETAWRNS